MKNSKLKYVLLTDVVGSRQIKDRKAFEKRLTGTLQKVQQQYASVFELPIQVWKGLDETAALLKEPGKLYDIMAAVDEGIAPFKMRFVLVQGAVDVMPQSGDISKADGPVFHLAASRMLALKKAGLKFSSQTAREQFDAAWQTQINLLWLLKKGWTDRQRQVYRLYCETGLQEAVGRQLKISQQQVSKTLKSIEAAQVQALEESLRQWTKREFENNVLD